MAMLVVLALVIITTMFYFGLFVGKWVRFMTVVGYALVNTPRFSELIADFDVSFSHCMPWHIIRTYRKYSDVKQHNFSFNK